MLFFDLCRLSLLLSEPIGNFADEIILELIDSTWNLIKNCPLDFKSRNTRNTPLSYWNSSNLRGNTLHKNCISWTQEILLGSHKEIRVWTGGKAQKRQGMWKNIIFRIFVTTLYMCIFRAWKRLCSFGSGNKNKPQKTKNKTTRTK